MFLTSLKALRFAISPISLFFMYFQRTHAYSPLNSKFDSSITSFRLLTVCLTQLVKHTNYLKNLFAITVDFGHESLSLIPVFIS